MWIIAHFVWYTCQSKVSSKFSPPAQSVWIIRIHLIIYKGSNNYITHSNSLTKATMLPIQLIQWLRFLTEFYAYNSILYFIKSNIYYINRAIINRSTAMMNFCLDARSDPAKSSRVSNIIVMITFCLWNSMAVCPASTYLHVNRSPIDIRMRMRISLFQPVFQRKKNLGEHWCHIP